MKMRIGVYVCHCGLNIGAMVDVPEVAKFAATLPDVAVAREYKYMCSDPGQEMIKKDIKEFGLESVVVASCSPRMHEPTFQVAIQEAGLNPYCFDMANIREHCSWVHTDKERATEKAKTLVAGAVFKASHLEPLETIEVDVTPTALVIGAGIAGMQAALDIADEGFKVYLVEKEPTIGGHMAQLDKTFPTLDCSACILTPKMVDVGRHPNIELITYAEVESVEGYIGNFNVRVRKKSRYIDENKCTGCGICAQHCPVKVLNEFDLGLGYRKATYVPFPQAIPMKYTIDRDNCIQCRTCENVCGMEAVDFDQKEEFLEFTVGAIVVATGFDLLDPLAAPEFGYGLENVITGLQFERLSNASGPTGGKLIINGKVPKDAVFISCVGSREKGGREYCSRFCCMYNAKQGHLVGEKIPDADVTILYSDMRAYGEGFEEFYNRVMEEGVKYVRRELDDPIEVKKKEGEEDRVVVVAKTENGEEEFEADLVVLANAAIAQSDAEKVRGLVSVSRSRDGFFLELHPKLRPIETTVDGIFLAGCAQSPKDIPDSVAQGSAAASYVCSLLSQKRAKGESCISVVNEDLCIGCGTCISVCPYGAVEFSERGTYGSSNFRKVAQNISALCKGCGICGSECPGRAINVKQFKDEQILAQVEGILSV
jgi:heterodisulfide reductase subunit A